MSATLALATDPSLSEPIATGIIDWMTGKNREVGSLIRGVVVTVAVLFVVITMIRTKMNLAAVIIAALVAGLAVWVVNNIESLQDRVGEELAAHTVVQTEAPPTDRLI